MKVIIGGGTGFIGRTLLRALIREKHEVVLLTRHPGMISHLGLDGVSGIQWDGESASSWADEIDGADAVINLAGESIAAKRWSQEQKEKIVASRVNSTKAIVQAVEKAKAKPSVLINASAIGFYGNVDEGKVSESTPKGKGFLADTCERWEKEAIVAEHFGVRVALLRIGIVLERRGGALAKMLPPFRFFAGGPLGSGNQWFPWVHRDDVVNIILFLLTTNVSGPVNATAPDSVRMKEFCKILGKVMQRPSWAPVPPFVLKLMLGKQMADELLLSGQCVTPERLEEKGYHFRHPKLEQALRSILNK